jgi:hypothetical protein
MPRLDKETSIRRSVWSASLPPTAFLIWIASCAAPSESSSTQASVAIASVAMTPARPSDPSAQATFGPHVDESVSSARPPSSSNVDETPASTPAPSAISSSAIAPQTTASDATPTQGSSTQTPPAQTPPTTPAQTPPQTPPQPPENPHKLTTDEARKAFGLEPLPPDNDAQAKPAEPSPAVAPAAAAAAPSDATHAQETGLAIHGYLSSQYRGRFADSQHDNDLYEFLSLDVGDAAKDKWTAHVSARMAADLDGRPATPPPPLFFNLTDTYDSQVNARLYEAHVDATDLGPLSVLKLGRQIDYDTPVYAWFDGAYAQSKSIGDKQLSFGAYGGVPVHIYESSRSGDVLGGAFAESKLWPQSRERLEWMHLEDSSSSTGYHDNNLWRLGVWQELGTNVHVDGNYTRLDDHNRDFSVNATWRERDDDLTMQASFYQLLEGQKALALEIDPFFTTLGELFPYYDARFLVSKGFGNKVNVQAGFDARRVTDDSNQGQFNHDFDRYFMTLVLSDMLPAGLVLSGTGEFWDSGATGITSAGADLSRHFGPKFDTSIGTYYSLYKTDLFSDVERDNVRTYYLRLRYHQGQSLTWDLRYEYESVDVGPFNTLILGLVWHF